ncbi:TPA: hypothetical protein DDX46_04930 [Candidatus Saccharibacteria bacterium]|nr:MAG: Peptidase M48 Ste24p [Candidatus Saccharibacteria bacterium GW2011_GWC2_44_17]OGL23096.1 MAG: hypothetical protein A2791_05465 [Candidatus Saccharibacteria bacterium RIFCSPHIGHO2_01_FULL_46_30]OGL34133.1 MAG: hypothetical protein A3E20_04500 [Candidatus Saccharibacteria bacterium RIFCSPHIGHO2_12_FULL_47_16]HBH78061.1 hypothetical protein [Candidatus Saccharibacteria bacterium]
MQQQPENEAVTKARRSSDLVVLISILVGIGVVLFVFFLMGLLLTIAGSEFMRDEYTGEVGTVVDYLLGIGFYAFFLGIFLVILLVTIRVMRQSFLGNALQVEYSNYAWLRDWSNKVAEDLQMPRVEIFITQDPVINAYAIGFKTPYNIMLNSGAIRYLSKEELKAVVVHEMAHVKYHHTQWNAYLGILTALPIIGGLTSWLIAFWGRRAELTADRLALCYLKDVELVKNSLVKVHVGPDVAASFNDVARQWQVINTESTFNRFSQTFSSHPFLVRRLQHLDNSTYLITPPAQKEAHATTH